MSASTHFTPASRKTWERFPAVTSAFARVSILVQLFPLSGNFLGVAFEDVTDRNRSEQVLRESEERFRLLIQGVQEYAIFRLDPLGQVVSWNSGRRALKRLTVPRKSWGSISLCFILQRT